MKTYINQTINNSRIENVAGGNIHITYQRDKKANLESELTCAEIFLNLAEREGIEMARAELALAKAKDQLNQLRQNQLGISNSIK